jgi:hypothetical protein
MAWKSLFTLLSLLIVSLFPALGRDSEPVTVSVEDLVIPAYLAGPPEPRPLFFFGRNSQGAEGRICPYPLYDKLTWRKEDQSYRMIHRENEFIRIGILPESGGRIFEGLGSLLFDHQPDAAFAWWDNAVNGDPDFAMARRNLGIACAHGWGGGNLETAARELEKAVEKSRDYPLHFHELDRVYDVWEGGTSTADDDWTDAHVLRGRRHLEAGNAEAALLDFREAAEHPDNLPSEARGSELRWPECLYWTAVASD